MGTGNDNFSKCKVDLDVETSPSTKTRTFQGRKATASRIFRASKPMNVVKWTTLAAKMIMEYKCTCWRFFNALILGHLHVNNVHLKFTQFPKLQSKQPQNIAKKGKKKQKNQDSYYRFYNLLYFLEILLSCLI